MYEVYFDDAFLVEVGGDDIWSPRHLELAPGASFIPLGPEVPTGESYVPSGGDVALEVTVQQGLIVSADGIAVTPAVRHRWWHGGWNSGGWVTEYKLR